MSLCITSPSEVSLERTDGSVVDVHSLWLRERCQDAANIDRRGELLMMDNCRLLHRAPGFDPREGLRYLQGCHIDIDGPRSLYRVLRRRRAP